MVGGVDERVAGRRHPARATHRYCRATQRTLKPLYRLLLLAGLIPVLLKFRLYP